MVKGERLKSARVELRRFESCTLYMSKTYGDVDFPGVKVAAEGESLRVERDTTPSDEIWMKVECLMAEREFYAEDLRVFSNDSGHYIVVRDKVDGEWEGVSFFYSDYQSEEILEETVENAISAFEHLGKT